MKSIEIYILSGFLGAGKTTFLQKILKEEQKKKKKTAVIMNEMGRVSIDSDAVSKKIPLKEILNGCVCCTLSDKLEAQLYELIHQYELDAIYIETTGVAHPVEVLDACLSPYFAEKVNVQSIITLVDANRWSDQHKLRLPLQKLVKEQVKHADVILLNKIDLISEEQLKDIENELRTFNPTATIIPTRFADIGFEVLHKTERKDQAEHEKTHAVKHLHIKSYVHTFSKPINKELFEEFLRTMPDSIYRIKGYIRFTDAQETFLFQYSYGMPLHTKSGINMKNTLVFIGDDLDHGYLQKKLSNLELNSM